MSKKIIPPPKELISVYQYAERKGVSATAVYDKIKVARKITVETLGKRVFIDWNEFKDVEFANAIRFVKPDEDELIIISELKSLNL